MKNMGTINNNCNMLSLNDNFLNNRYYGGSSTKFGITYNNVNYIVKLSENNNYTVYSEYIASTFIRCLGISVHNATLAQYQGVYSRGMEIVVLLEDFTDIYGELHEFGDTRQSSEETPIDDKGYSYSDIIDLIEKHTKIVPEVKPKMIKHFWEQFICDAILANRDRHAGNWGYIINKSGVYMPAPLYDNGNSLFPNINERELELRSLKTKQDYYTFLKERVLVYPASIIKIYDAEKGRLRRTNYCEMFKDFRKYPVLSANVKQLISKFSLQDIFNIIINIVKPIYTLDIVYKRFYVFIVCLRYLCIIQRQSYDKAFNVVYDLCEKYKIV